MHYYQESLPYNETCNQLQIFMQYWQHSLLCYNLEVHTCFQFRKLIKSLSKTQFDAVYKPGYLYACLPYLVTRSLETRNHLSAMNPTNVSHRVPVFAFLMSVQYNSLVLVCAYSSLAVLVLVAVCKIYVYMMVKILKKLTELKRLFFCENIIDTGKFTISLYCLTYIGSWFSLLTVVIIAFTFAKSLPQ